MRESITKETSKGMLYLCNKCKQYLPKNKFNIDNTNLRYIDIDLEYLFYLWTAQNGKCALTGMQMTYKFYEGRVDSNLSIDRIDSTKGYSKDNVQLVCMAANQMKNDLSMEELTSLCSMILNTVNESKNSNHENN